MAGGSEAEAGIGARGYSTGVATSTDPHPAAGPPRFFFPILLSIICGALWFIIQGWQSRPAGGQPAPAAAGVIAHAPDPTRLHRAADAAASAQRPRSHGPQARSVPFVAPLLAQPERRSWPLIRSPLLRASTR